MKRLRNRGAVLVLVLGVLMILALLGATFARVQTSHKEVSGSFTDDVRAKLVAQSGIEDALDRLKSIGSGVAWQFKGNDINEDGIISAGEVDAPYETTTSPVGVEWAKSPSFADEVDGNPDDPLNPQPKIVTIASNSAGGQGTRRWGISGTLGANTGSGAWGTYANRGDAYAIKVNDSSGLVYLNDGAAQNGPLNAPTYNASSTRQSSVAQNLKMILTSLGKALNCTTPNIGDVIVNARPPVSGFAVKDDIQPLIGIADFNKIRDYVTTNAWVDKNVVNPVPLSTSAMNYYAVKYHRGSTSNPVTRRSGSGARAGVNYNNAVVNAPLMWLGTTPSSNGGSVVTNASAAGVYGLDELFPQYVEVTHRAPVNVNTAPLAVLEALIAEVQGVFLLEPKTDAPHGNSPNSFAYGGQGYGGSYINFTVARWSGSGSNADGYGWTWLYEKHSYAPGSPASYTAVGNNATIGVGNKPDYDEIGYLYSTARFAGSWEGTGGSGATIPARYVAEHIVACRAARPGIANPTTIGGATIDYSTKPFGGPFRTWSQFHAFIDNLVVEGGPAGQGLIRDQRTGFWQGYNGAPAIAGQAAADALKANFNPNCHLNEANPDRNLFLLVDKTDLIRNTTEFTFRPTGYFEVEAIGRVLRPMSTVMDVLFPGVQCEIRGEKKVTVAVKQYELYRETSQRHFYPGALAPRVTYSTAVGAADATNNNLSLEIGPEPDNSAAMVYDDLWGLGSAMSTGSAIDGYAGVKPVGSPYAWTSTGWGYEFDGYIQLATLGGPFAYGSVPPPIPFNLDNTHTAPVPFYGRKSAKPQLVGVDLNESGNAALTPKVGETMRGHFAFNDILSYAAGTLWWRRENVAANTTNRSSSAQSDFSNPSWFNGANNPKNEAFENYKDYAIADTSPYFTAKGGQYRTARSFRMPLVGGGTGSGTGALPALPTTGLANTDLRMDGLYVERHSGAAYWMDEGVTFSNTLGTVSVWVKPYFMPEYTGKARNLIAMARYHAKNRGYNNPENFNLMYMPAHTNPGQDQNHHQITTTYGGNAYGAGNDAPEPATGGQNITKFRPMSLFWDTFTGCFSGGLDDVNHEGPWLEFHYGHNSFTMNHNDHAVHATWPNHLEGHRWSHVTTQWFNNPAGGTQYTTNHASRTWTNGQLVGGKEPGDLSATGTGANAAKTPVGAKTTWFRAGSLFQSGHSNSNERPYFSFSYWGTAGSAQHRTNALRLGETSYHGVPVANGSETNTYPRNWSADCTFDELYMWKGPSNTTFSYAAEGNNQYYGAGCGQDMYRRGRYYHPQQSGSPTESFFISPWIDFGGLSAGRVLAPATTAAAPLSTGEGGATPGVTINVPAGSLGGRTIVGISWTWYAEDYDTTVPQLAGNQWGRMIPIARDWTGMMNGQNPETTPAAKIGPQTVSEAGGGLQGLTICRVFLDVKTGGTGSVQYPPAGAMQGAVNVGTNGYVEDGYSTVNIPLNNGSLVRYKVWFQIAGLNGNHCLLETPVFDDITFYLNDGGTKFLSWSMQ